MSKSHPRIIREKKTIDVMVNIYCKAHHNVKGGELCPKCNEFLSYAFLRLDNCPFQEEKSTCGKCLVHCYQPQMREKAYDKNSLQSGHNSPPLISWCALQYMLTITSIVFFSLIIRG